MQERCSVESLLMHIALPQVNVVRVRDSMPVHPLPPKHGPQGPVVVMPQLVPSVSREQLRESLRDELPQLPPAQAKSVQVRDWVPISSQVSENEPQVV